MEFDDGNLVLSYTGSEISANILKEYLAEADIHSIVKNEKKSSLSAGFGTASGCEVYIFERDIKKAAPLLRGFTETDKS